MADNVNVTAGTGTIIATDDVGGGVQVQRVKATFGVDGTATDVSATNPLPIVDPDTTASGTISATDAVLGTHAGAGVLLTGTPTASSYVAMALTGGEAGFVLQLSGTFGAGTVWFECSADSTTGINGNWTTLSMRVLGTTGSTLKDSTTTAGLFRGTASGMTYVRARITGATTPSVAVVYRATSAPGPIALNAPLPAGTNLIGTIGKAPSATGTITSPALSTSSFTVLAANTARLGATVFNDSVNTLYLALASTASTTSFTVQIPAGGYYELPSDACGYTGIITGISTVASGNCRVTELTA